MFKGIGQLFLDQSGLADEMASLSVIGVLTFLAISVYAYVWHGQSFDPLGFGSGLGAAVGGAAAGIGLKSRMEKHDV